MKKILGAGPAGLCAAINLAKGGEQVTVFEKRADVGLRFPANLQGIKYINDPREFMKEMGLGAKVDFRYFSKVIFGTRSRDIELDTGQHKKIPFVERGGRRSLEYALFKEAEKLGAAFRFNSREAPSACDIIAAGGSGCDFAALGGIYEDSDFPRDRLLVVFDDRYSPKGWYSYIFPISKDQIEFVNCVSQPHVPKLFALTNKAIRERKILRDFLGGKKKISAFGGSGTVRVPKTGYSGGKILIGEAAGFQDPFMGFGIKYALMSGKLCADAILQGKDYDALWRSAILPDMKKDLARRLPLSLFGDSVVEFFMRKHRNGAIVDISNAAPERFPLYWLIENLFFEAERLKFGLTGRW
ncbi:TPA: NAD(P)/FAD-dependent oxidoreductase [Candidatus Micrarchaeota archaeon]|nr:NAD(P)/FAD-dependent oxidoreductase [Candidatus Micrarchaeota archaeon]HIH30552.1 NAD(P)/FAD-dependent oxidoreductase [Candidatus Micrarchaeota archaeon]